MATSIVFPRVQFFADNGKLLIGGRIHTYIAGTSSRAPTYKDAARAQPNTNPIILDGRAEASIYLTEGVEYKFVIEDSTGALIMTQEPVYGAIWPDAASWPSDVTLTYQYMMEARDAASAIGPIKFYDTYAQAAGDLPNLSEDDLVEIAHDETRTSSPRARYKVNSGALVFVIDFDVFYPNLTNSVLRPIQSKLRDTISVKDFGAVGDGVTDDTAVIQAALDSGVKCIYVPEGTYIISGAGLSCPDDITIFGAGKGRTTLKLASGLTNIYPILHERLSGGVLQPIKDIHCEGITFLGNGSISEKVPATSALFRCYASERNTFVDCEFKNGRGYGVGLQGSPVAVQSDKRGPHVGDRFIRCDFIENGLQDYIIGPDTMDGMDVKNSDRIYVEGCTFIQNGDKGLDIRGTNAKVIGCLSDGNTVGLSLGPTEGYFADGEFIGCTAFDASIAGFQFYGTPTSNKPSEFLMDSCKAYDNVRGVIIPSGVPGVIDGNFNLKLTSSSLLRNSIDGLQINSIINRLHSVGCDFESNGRYGVLVSDLQTSGKPLIFDSSYIGKNTQGGFRGSNNSAAEHYFNGGVIDANFSFGIHGNDNIFTSGTVFIRNQGSNHFDAGNKSRSLSNNLAPSAVASASTISIPPERSTIVVTGTTNINSIAGGWNGQVVIIRFNDVLTVSDGGTLMLNGALVTANQTTLTLTCDGTNWRELSRSVN